MIFICRTWLIRVILCKYGSIWDQMRCENTNFICSVAKTDKIIFVVFILFHWDDEQWSNTKTCVHFSLQQYTVFVKYKCVTKTVFSLYVGKQQSVNEFLFFILAKTFITYNPLIRYLHKQKMKVFLHITSNHLWYLFWKILSSFFSKKALGIILTIYELEYLASIVYLREICLISLSEVIC